MKNLYLTLFCIALCCNIHAQRERSEFSFNWAGDAKGNGIPSVFVIGVSGQYAMLRATNAPGYLSAAQGWRAHFGVGVPISNRFFIHPEIALSQLRTGNATNGLRMATLDLPVQFALHLGNKRQWMLKAGPELSLALNGYQKNNGTEQRIYQQINQTQWFLQTTVEYLPNRFGLSARYRHGLSRIGDASNNVLQGKFSSLSIGAIYRLAKKVK